MRTNNTTYQRAIAQARKLQPETKQINNSLFFEVASTSVLDGWHRVTLGPNKFNPLIDSSCDCGTPKYLTCCHKLAALLQYTVNLENRCQNGYDYLHTNELTPETYQTYEDLFVDLLDRYTRCLDLIRAIEEGFDISQPQFSKPYREILNPLTDPILLTA